MSRWSMLTSQEDTNEEGCDASCSTWGSSCIENFTLYDGIFISRM